jgi:hypothetical protein
MAESIPINMRQTRHVAIQSPTVLHLFCEPGVDRIWKVRSFIRRSSPGSEALQQSVSNWELPGTGLPWASSHPFTPVEISQNFMPVLTAWQ